MSGWTIAKSPRCFSISSMSGARGPRPCWRIESSSVRVRSVAPRRRVRAAIACLELGVRPVVAATSQQAEDAVLAAADAAEDVHAAIFFDERGLTELLLRRRRRRVCSASPLLLGARRAGEAAVGVSPFWKFRHHPSRYSTHALNSRFFSTSVLSHHVGTTASQAAASRVPKVNDFLKVICQTARSTLADPKKASALVAKPKESAEGTAALWHVPASAEQPLLANCTRPQTCDRHPANLAITGKGL